MYTGVWPAMLTPFDRHGEVDLPATDRLVEYLLGEGAQGFYVCGSTGEGLLMNVQERAAVAERVVRRVRGRVPVMVHVGAIPTRDAVALARHAREVGADAVAAIPPTFFGYSFNAIKTHYRLIAEAADIPTFAYNIPHASGVNLTPAMFAEMGREIPNLVGMKFTSHNFFEMRQIMEIPGMTVLSGPDEMFLPALSMGIEAAIGSTYNIMTAHFVALYNAFKAGRLAEAQELQLVANRVIKVFLAYPGSLKVMMRWQGVPVGEPRRPLEPLPAEREDALRADLMAIGYPYPVSERVIAA
jgi:N-acetylneuraminate lyase